MTTTETVTDRTVEAQTSRVSGWGRLGYAALVLSAVALAATGIGTFLLGKAPMTHWVLMAHASAAPLFAIGLALVALTWSERSRFGATSSTQSRVGKALLWLILASGLIVILSGVVPMTPIFGTPGQHFLYLTHRYGAMVLAAAVVLHLLTLRRAR